MSYPANFKPNFFAENSVTLPHPVSTVFSKLATRDGLKDTIELSSLVTHCDVLEEDQVAISGPLLDNYARHLPSSSSVDDSSKRLLPRLAFTLTEKIPLIPYLYSYSVVNKGTLTRDPDAHEVLYEVQSGAGVAVVKTRVFEEVDGGKETKVTETIRGMCPSLLRGIVQKTTGKAHREHMELYSTLF
ncbi:hypothetical protein DL96DRAFT_1678007 [Flagelloscypha sp. PMI_526]|nr:hypothetical protein DL96DRAFT_1678007 [Flagelloscypha sp. PMI_526]